MNRKTFLLSVIIALILSLGLLISACGDDDDDDAEEEGDDDAVDDDDAADDDDDDDDDAADDDDDDDDYNFGDVTGYVDIEPAEDLLCEGDYCYVVAKYSGLFVVDVSDVASPSIVGEYDPASGECWNLVKDGDFLYVANRDSLLKIDVSDPTDPQEEWAFTPTTIGVLNGIALGDGVIYIGGSEGSNGYIEVVEESKGTPASAGELQISSDETCYNMAYADDVAYCAGGEGTFFAIDVSDPSSMAILDEYYNAGTPGHDPWGQDVKIDGDVAYFSDWGAGLIAMGISDPSSMEELSVLSSADGFYSSYNAGALTIGATDYDKVLAAADGWGGLLLVDASDPADLTQIGDALDLTVDLSSAPHGVHVMGNYAYVADNGEQMLIIVKIAD